jgi:hypothetical protein
MQDVSRGTITEPVEDLVISRSIVPCGTIPHFFTLIVGQPTKRDQDPIIFGISAILIEARRLTTLGWADPRDSFHVEQTGRSLTT